MPSRDNGKIKDNEKIKKIIKITKSKTLHILVIMLMKNLTVVRIMCANFFDIVVA